MGSGIKILQEILRECREEQETEMEENTVKPPIIRVNDNGQKEKYCSACKDYHPATDKVFYKDGRSSTGLSSWCKKQTLAKQKKYKKKGTAETAAATPQTLVLDFTPYELMIEDIRLEAFEAFRTTEEHAMFLISESLYKSKREKKNA